MHTRTRTTRRFAFTLIEMMITITITVFLMLIISRVFDSVGEAITTGKSTSEILSRSRMVVGQVTDDFTHMVPPDENGVLVIINQRIDDVPVSFADPDRRRNARVDQIMFIRERNDADPITPRDTTDFTSVDTKASYMKVWYGHALKANPDGTRPSRHAGRGG